MQKGLHEYSKSQKHIRNKHKIESLKEDTSSTKSSAEDNLQRYTIVSIVLGLIFLDFNDARKLRDRKKTKLCPNVKINVRY